MQLTRRQMQQYIRVNLKKGYKMSQINKALIRSGNLQPQHPLYLSIALLIIVAGFFFIRPSVTGQVVLEQRYDIPEGYSPAAEPFNVQCDKPSEINIKLPAHFSDLRLLTCRGSDCAGPHPVTITAEETLDQDGFSEDAGKSYLHETVRVLEKPSLFYLQAVDDPEITLPYTLDKKVYEKSITIMAHDAGRWMFLDSSIDKKGKIVSARIPYDLVDENNTVKAAVAGVIQGLEQQGFMILQEPSRFNAAALQGSAITLPYSLNRKVQEDSLVMLAKEKGSWIQVKSRLDKDGKILTAQIEDLPDKDPLELAVGGSFIDEHINATLDRIYNPGSRDAVVLVHGFGTTPETFSYLIEDIKESRQPYQVWAFGYSTRNYIDKIASDLAGMLDSNIAEYDRLYIVTHSLGGMIAQKALLDSYALGRQFVSRVEKVILIAAPNEGSVVADAYENLFSLLVNAASGIDDIYATHPLILEDLKKGNMIPRIAGVDYYVIAGTMPYTQGLMGSISKSIPAEIKHDGVVSTQSARNIGGEYVDDMCKNYWEVNMTHMELVDDFTSRRIIGNIISEQVQRSKALGQTQTYTFTAQCADDLFYLPIGKKIGEDAIMGCSCGDKICSSDENMFSCPADCAIFLAPEKGSNFPAMLLVAAVVMALIMLYFRRLSRGKNL